MAQLSQLVAEEMEFGQGWNYPSPELAGQIPKLLRIRTKIETFSRTLPRFQEFFNFFDGRI